MQPKLKNIEDVSTVSIISEPLHRLILNAVISFRGEITKVQGVKKVAYHPKGKVITIWTFVDRPEDSILNKIYEIEKETIEQFPDLLFDFTVIFNPEATVPTEFIQENLT